MKDPKAIIDIMLGAIAIVGRTRTLQAYLNDLEERGTAPPAIPCSSLCGLLLVSQQQLTLR